MFIALVETLEGATPEVVTGVAAIVVAVITVRTRKAQASGFGSIEEKVDKLQVQMDEHMRNSAAFNAEMRANADAERRRVDRIEVEVATLQRTLWRGPSRWFRH